MRQIGWMRPYLREAAGLSVASAAAQLITLVFSPVVLRRYGADAFGLSSLTLAVAGSLGQLFCLKYDQALLALPSQQEDEPLALAALLFVCGFSFLLLGGSLFAAIPFEIALLLGLISAAVGFYAIGSALCLRHSNPDRLAKATVLRAALQVAAQLMLSRQSNQSAALLVSYLVSYLGGALLVWPPTFSGRVEWRLVRRMAWQHREYPLLLLPGALVFSLAGWLHQSMVLHFDPGSLGCYAMVERLLGAPMTVVSAAVGQLFLRWISPLPQNRRRELYARVSVSMLALAGFGCLLLYPAAPLLVRVFGEEWRDAVGILRVLLPFFAVRFAVAPVASGLIAADRRGMLALWQCLTLLLTAGSVAFATLQNLPLLSYLAVYSVLLCAGYLMLWSWGRSSI